MVSESAVFIGAQGGMAAEAISAWPVATCQF